MGPEAHSPSTAAPPRQRTQLQFQRDSLFMQTSAPPYAPVPRQQGTLSWSQPHLKYLPKRMPSLTPNKVDAQRGLKHSLPGGQNHANMREQGEQATEGLLPLSMARRSPGFYPSLRIPTRQYFCLSIIIIIPDHGLSGNLALSSQHRLANTLPSLSSFLHGDHHFDFSLLSLSLISPFSIATCPGPNPSVLL